MDNQAIADKEAKKIVRLALKHGNTVGFSLSRLIDLGFSLKVIKSVIRSKQ